MEFFWGTLLVIVGLVFLVVLLQLFAKGAKGLRNATDQMNEPDSGFQKSLNWMERKSQEMEQEHQAKQAAKQARREAKKGGTRQ